MCSHTGFFYGLSEDITFINAKTMPEETTTPNEEGYVINYVIHIHDNHGTIYIAQTGKPDETPPPPYNP